MSFRILIPAKPLIEGKSRLAPLLNGASRAALCEQFLRRTVAAEAASDIDLPEDYTEYLYCGALNDIRLTRNGAGLRGVITNENCQCYA